MYKLRRGHDHLPGLDLGHRLREVLLDFAAHKLDALPRTTALYRESVATLVPVVQALFLQHPGVLAVDPRRVFQERRRRLAEGLDGGLPVAAIELGDSHGPILQCGRVGVGDSRTAGRAVCCLSKRL